MPTLDFACWSIADVSYVCKMTSSFFKKEGMWGFGKGQYNAH